jgi:hypothetical protein
VREASAFVNPTGGVDKAIASLHILKVGNEVLSMMPSIAVTVRDLWPI